MDGSNPNLAWMSDPATEPIDLSQAFKIYNQANRAAAQGAVEPAEPSDDGDTEGNEPDVEAEQQVPTGEDEPAAPNVSNVGDNLGIGGSANVVEPIDFDARKQEILRQIQSDALRAVRADFSKNNIAECSIEDLYSRDESTGRVRFKNPDDPGRDFASRAEAQQWVDAFNKQIDARFRQEVNKKQRELLGDYAPTLRLIEFAPKYEGLDKVTKDVFDDLIDPYAVRNRSGNIIGYNIDLNAMLSQAKKIAKRFAMQPEPAKPEGEPPVQPKVNGRPAFNMPTGSGKSADDKEPETIGEALKLYDKRQREKGKKK